jgi:uncharacterized protein YjiS (DUF1127 family)
MNPLAFLLRRSRERRSYGNLLNLDDRLLRDIGVTRSDIMQLQAGRSLRKSR